MVRQLIFDLDGTLLDTLDDLAISMNYALKLNGFNTHPLEAYRYFVGNGITKLVERALPEEARNEATILQVRQDFVNYYTNHNMDQTRPYPGIETMIAQLQKRRIHMAVASNKYQSATTRLIAHYFTAGTFDVVFGQRDGVPAKPHPAVVNDILSQTRIAKRDTLYMGDSGVDMLTAHNSGLRSIAVTWGFRPRKELEENGARFVIDHPAQLLEIIDAENK